MELLGSKTHRIRMYHRREITIHSCIRCWEILYISSRSLSFGERKLFVGVCVCADFSFGVIFLINWSTKSKFCAGRCRPSNVYVQNVFSWSFPIKLFLPNSFESQRKVYTGENPSAHQLIIGDLLICVRTLVFCSKNRTKGTKICVYDETWNCQIHLANLSTAAKMISAEINWSIIHENVLSSCDILEHLNYYFSHDSSASLIKLVFANI